MMRVNVKIRFIRLFSGILCAGLSTVYADDVIQPGDRRELFVDKHLIESMENARLELQHPQPQGVALRFDRNWEGRYCGYVTVFKDNDLYRMYYRALPEAGKDGSTAERTCYAESADGVTWKKPNLGIYEVEGTNENNIVLANTAPFSHNFAPFLDSRPGVPAEERYKALAGVSDTGLHAFVSSDGLHWTKRKQVITEGAFDSQNVAFWSESENAYVCYFRTWTQGAFAGFRSISRCVSSDFEHWSEPVPMNFGDTPPEHLYTNQTTPYFRAPHLYIGLAARFMPGRKVISQGEVGQIGVEEAYAGDCSDGVLLTSRGGNKYDRTFMEGFILPGIGAEHWTSRSNYAACGIVPLDDKTMGIYVQERYGQPAACLRLHTLRTDGFAGVTAPYSGGTLVTKPFTFKGQRLSLNALTSAAGGIKVEVQDEAGMPIPGFALAEFREIIGNDLELECQWTAKENMMELAGKVIRLKFILHDTKIFSFRFSD